ncbi:hypothetical protein CC2G_011796 [Coprinopsis cinerea AmutBmut pab1-1]|nr:hypothetical protein CC2G_011796 [Coprinopsis cinerea AmutBmut pab1-1]
MRRAAVGPSAWPIFGAIHIQTAYRQAPHPRFTRRISPPNSEQTSIHLVGQPHSATERVSATASGFQLSASHRSASSTPTLPQGRA